MGNTKRLNEYGRRDGGDEKIQSRFFAGREGVREGSGADSLS